jgi:hypothetical protein
MAPVPSTPQSNVRPRSAPLPGGVLIGLATLVVGLGSDPTVVTQLVAFGGVFAVLGGFEIGFLTVSARRALPAPRSRYRPEWWEHGRDVD